MQIFLSHSSEQKPLVREVKRHLPVYLGSWIDEEKLLFGDNLAGSIQDTIKSDTDYVLLFIDAHAAASPWVLTEIEWTLQAEKRHGRTILLPIVLDTDALALIANSEIQTRKHLRLKDFLESSVRALADSIASELFALVCRDITHLRSPRPRSTTAAITDAATLFRANAALIQKAVFPHRRDSPISREVLRDVINTERDTPIAPDEFETLLASIAQQNLIPGLFYDGVELYLVEEHASWKAEVQRDQKERIAKCAAALVQNGMTLFVDAGSTTEQLIRILCKRIETRAIRRITIATTSINIADMLSDCCVAMGFDDDFSAVRLFVPGGQVRPSTQAIVSLDIDPIETFRKVSDHVGGFDLALLGSNGVSLEAGFTTHDNAEAANKRAIVRTCKSSIVVADSSKLGIVLETQFATFTDDVKLIVDKVTGNPKLDELIAAHGPQILLA